MHGQPHPYLAYDFARERHEELRRAAGESRLRRQAKQWRRQHRQRRKP